jgi:starch phosphorylase
LKFLEVLSRNFWWSWHRDAIALFCRIDPRLWQQVGGNPIDFLTRISQHHLEMLAQDRSFLAHLERVRTSFDAHIKASLDGVPDVSGPADTIAYFSMEFGIHESLPIYAGGLGILAGDHLKAVSDRGVALIGVGLLYQHGYFRQFLDQNGWQHEEYPETDFYLLPMRRARNQAGEKITISVSGPSGDIHAAVWKIAVGQTSLYLLDTNLNRNSPETREITSQLYSGDKKLRLAQEVLLGIGGMRALNALGIFPSVCHLNEGHCSFVGVEWLAQIIEQKGVDLATALEIVPRATVFTTHTPVAAGHDEFPVDLVLPYLRPLEARLTISAEKVISWGQFPGSGPNSPLSMFVLGAKLAQHINGVSELHGRVARRMWTGVWPGLPEEEIPIGHITNGVHLPSWISSKITQLLEQHLGPEWYRHISRPETIEQIDHIYDEELWSAHEMSRSRLIRTCREHLRKQYARCYASRTCLLEAESVLDQDALTIAFARRFATYKRAHLIFNNPERLKRILTSQTHPVQFIFAGKAHPSDNEGKALIQKIFQFARDEQLTHKLVFIDDYDIHVARHFIQGADIWLNTPRRPLEACGTSGMKAAANGLLNLSVLDGWWCEGYSKERGWRIGHGEEYADASFQDDMESQALYDILENDVIPCFYDRKNGKPPSVWLKMMKAAIKMAITSFASYEMVAKYEKRYYQVAVKQFKHLIADSAKAARHLAKQRERHETLWKRLRIEHPQKNVDGPFRVGEKFPVTCRVMLGELLPEEVDVELYYGHIKNVDLLIDGKSTSMIVEKDLGEGLFLYTGDISCNISGRYGFTARILPKGDAYIKATPGLITWA